ncbi:MAG: BatA domain-containing protein [Myxococcota bacterium]
MQFENPWLLLGMAAGAIPVVIHLVNRRRARLRRFAAVEFLLLSDKRVARRLKVRQLLVLALRVLLMMAIPFALSKPYFEEEPALGADLGEPGAVALVVDDSLSMQARPGGGDETLLDRALAQADAIVESGGDRTAFAVAAAGEPARLLTPGITYDRQTLERALERITSGPRAADTAGALREAERVLSQSAEPRRRVVVLSDHSAHAWADVTEPWALAQPPGVDLRSVREPDEAIDNVAITGVSVRPAPDVGPGQVHVEITVANHGEEPATRRVDLDLGGRTSASTVTIPARGTERVGVVDRLPATASTVRGAASMPPDDLPEDDTWYFTVDFGGAVNVGVVNGAPRNVPYLDELFFVRAALGAAESRRARIHPVYLSPKDVEPSRLEHMDVVVLANVGSLTSAQQIALSEFVEGGGGLLVTAGGQLTPESSRSYGDLMPFPVRSIKEVADPDDPAMELSALRLDDVDFDHPIMADFTGIEDLSLFKARTWTYALLDTIRREGARVVAAFSGGAPAIAEAEVGDGRVMMWTSSIDRDWSDLVIRTSFVPLLQQTVLYLGGKLAERGGGGTVVGEVARVPVPEGEGSLVLERPDGREVAPLEPVPGEEVFAITETDAVGHYTLRRRVGDREATIFAVNGDRAESDLTRADLVDVRAVLERPGPGAAPAPGGEEVAAAEAPSDQRQKIWPFVLVGLFWLLASEAWLVIRS